MKNIYGILFVATLVFINCNQNTTKSNGAPVATAQAPSSTATVPKSPSTVCLFTNDIKTPQDIPAKLRDELLVWKSKEGLSRNYANNISVWETAVDATGDCKCPTSYVPPLSVFFTQDQFVFFACEPEVLQ